MNRYEYWSFPDSCALWSIPNYRRMHQIREPGAILILRIDAVDWEDAKRQRDEYIYCDNPQGLSPLNIPAEELMFSQYSCGINEGDRLRVIEDYPLIVNDYVDRILSPGTLLKVLKGDCEYQDWIFVHLKENEQGISYFEIHERDYLEKPFFRLERD